jgi:hypothetical protein
VEHRVLLTLTEDRVGWQQILTLSQAPNRKPDDVNHTEPEFLLQAVNEMQVRVREANGRRFEFVVLHEWQFSHPNDWPVVAQ